MKSSTSITDSPSDKKYCSYFLCLIILWVWGSNAIWMVLDNRPPAWDQAGHLRYTFHYWQVLTSGSANWWVDLLNVEPFYPPFFHLSLIPFSLIFGFSMDTAIAANSFYLTVSILSIYGIGKTLYNRHVGLIAGFLISCYPYMVNMSREYVISTMLTSAITLTYLLFIKSNNFEDKVFSFFFSLAYACGLMIKWTFLIYTLPAVLVILFNGSLAPQKRLKQCLFYIGMIFSLLVLPFFIFISGEISGLFLLTEFILIGILSKSYSTELLSPQKLLNLIVLTCTAVLICFPWYAHNTINISIGMSKFGFPSEVLKGSMDWNLPIWGFYMEMAGRQMGIPLLFLFVFSIIFLQFKKDGIKGIILAWAILPIILFTFINNKDARYTMPTLPAMALISSLALAQIQSFPWRKCLYALTGVLGLATSVYAGFGSGSIPSPVLGGQLFGSKNPPVTQNWPIDKVLDDIISEADLSSGDFLTVRTLTNHMFFQRGGFRDIAEIRGLPITMKSVKRNVGEMTDFFITKTGDFGLHAYKDINPKLTRLLENPALKKTFTPFKSYPLPDGSEGLVLKKNIQPATDLPDVDNLEEVGKRFMIAFGQYPIYGIKDAINPKVTIIPTENLNDVFLGRYKQIIIKADSVVSNKIKITDFELVFENVQINIYDLLLNNKLILFDLERLTPKGTLNFDSLEKDAYKAMKEKGTVKIEGFDNGILLHASYSLPQGKTLKGSARIKLLFSPGKHIKPIVEYIKLGPFDIPPVFFRRITDKKIILESTPGWPLETNIQTIQIHPRKLQINPTMN
jgi:4-amino-4-deoxy-L-arabinose transferase-like glycosyltransferase